MCPKSLKVAEPQIEPKAVKEPVEKVYTVAEHERHWAPLNQAVTPQEAAHFAWRQDPGSIQSYMHVETGRHVHIDGADSQFYDRNRDPISTREGLDYAMPEGKVHSHSRDLPEINIEGFGLGL